MAIPEVSSSWQVSASNNCTCNETQGLGEVCMSGDNESETEEYQTEDNENAAGGCNFGSETAMNGVEDLTSINFGVISLEDLMRFHFPDTSVAFMFYNWYASKHGFAARKSRVVRNCNGDIIQQTFVCHREGHRDEKCIDTVGKKRQSRPKTRCGCEARCQVHIQETSTRWYIKYFNDVHNHSFLEDSYEGMLPAHRKMSDYDKYQMMSMRNSGIRTSHIYGFVANQTGGYDKVGYLKRDMYNEQTKQRRTKYSDAKAALDFLKGLCSRDDKMFWRHTVDQLGQLQNVFWCDGVSRMDYSVFGDVLAFDATYQKLRYLCPLVVFSGVNHHNQSIVFAAAIVVNETEETYVWLLEQFLEALGGKSPVSVITDGDLAMRNAIRRAIPTAHHRLCAWHLIRNATTNIKNAKFLTKFKQCMLGDFDVGEFNHKWDEMVAEFGLEENTWVLEMYEKRKMWATSYIRGKFFAGFRTTSRCEGLHSEFGKYVNVRNNLMDFLQHFFRWLDYMRYREVEADFSSSYGEPVLQTQYWSLERSASKLYTREILKLFQPILQRACRCIVVGSRQTPTIFIYTVCKYGKECVEWRVSFCQSSLEFKCSCMRFESLGIPCEHLVAVLLLLGIVQLPDCLVLKRWTKAAKDSIVLPAGYRRLSRDPELISTYVGIVERCKKMATAAIECGRPEYLRKTIDLISTHTGLLEAVRRGKDIAAPTVDPYIDGTIKNPAQVRTKGCGGVSSSRTKSKKTPRKKPKCGLCGGKGHNRKSCHVQRKLNFTSQSEVASTSVWEDEDEQPEESDYENIVMSFQ